jgi:hypothetical protein
MNPILLNRGYSITEFEQIALVPQYTIKNKILSKHSYSTITLLRAEFKQTSIFRNLQLTTMHESQKTSYLPHQQSIPRSMVKE